MHKALERERYLRRPVVQAKLWLQHLIAGEPRFPQDAEVDAELDKEIHAAPAPGHPAGSGAEPAGRGEVRGIGSPRALFYDTEFIDNGRIIDLISIGVVAEDGREFYAISTEFDPESAGRWVRTTSCPNCPRRPRSSGGRGGRSGRVWRSSSTSMATSRSSCGPGWRPTTTSRCANCGVR